jgi:hypothetical protein
MTVEEFMKRTNQTALDKGWWEKNENGSLKPRNDAEMISLMHSELSEALEIYRDPDLGLTVLWQQDDGKPEGFAVELVDLLIRIVDTCAAKRLPLGGVTRSMMFDQLSKLGVDYGYFDQVSKGEGEVGEWISAMHAELTMVYKELKCGDPISAAIHWGTIFNMVGLVFSHLPAPVLRVTETVDLSKRFASEKVFSEVRQVLRGMINLGKFDLESVAQAKMIYNDSRPFRHGGKRC